MAVNVLPKDFLLRKHTAELYLTKKVEAQVPFLSMLPKADTETGEFATVIESTTAKEDMDSEVLGEPLTLTEGSELTDVVLEPLNAKRGETSAVGYQLKYTKKFLNRQDSAARVQIAVSKAIAGMAHKLNATFASEVANAAGLDIPSEMSDWANAIDPRNDAILIRSAFSAGQDGTKDTAFNSPEAFVGNNYHTKLQQYYMSMDWPFNANRMDVDGTYFNNVKNALNNLTNVDLVVIDNKVPPGIIQKYIDPDYSTIRQSELSGADMTDFPDSLIMVNLVEPKKYEDPYIMQIISEVGYSSQEPLGAMAGAL